MENLLRADAQSVESMVTSQPTQNIMKTMNEKKEEKI